MNWSSKAADKILPRRNPPSLPPPPINSRYQHSRTSSAPQLEPPRRFPPFDIPRKPLRSNGVSSYPSSAFTNSTYYDDGSGSSSSGDTIRTRRRPSEIDVPSITITLPTPAPTPVPPEMRSPTLPIPRPKATKIDFIAANLPCYANRYAAVIDNIFTPADCGQLLALAELYAAEHAAPGTPLSAIWSPALMMGNNKRSPSDAPPELTVRSCSRIVVDSEALSEQIFYKLLPYLQDIAEVRKVKARRGRSIPGVPPSFAWVRLRGMHSKLKFLKYHPGDHFRAHTDGMYISEDRTQASYYSIIIFLASPTSGGGTSQATLDGSYPGGGCTRIWEDKNQWPLNPVTGQRERPPGWIPRYLDIEPVQGRVLIFEQNGMRHSGEEVTAGVKYVMKADLMYGEVEGGGGRPWEGPHGP